MKNSLHHFMCRCRLARCEYGGSLIEVAIMIPLMLTILVGAVDLGRAYYAAVEIQNAAEAGALYGSQNPTNTTGMQAAAKLDAVDVPIMTATATYGCECSDGTNAVSQCTIAPTCTSNVVNYVQVSTAAAYTPVLYYPGVPSALALKGFARLRAAH